MVLSLRITAPSLAHKYMDIYIYTFICISMYAFVCVCVCVCVSICIYKFGPGVDSGNQPLSANKRKDMSAAHLLITKPHA